MQDLHKGTHKQNIGLAERLRRVFSSSEKIHGCERRVTDDFFQKISVNSTSNARNWTQNRYGRVDLWQYKSKANSALLQWQGHANATAKCYIVCKRLQQPHHKIAIKNLDNQAFEWEQVNLTNVILTFLLKAIACMHRQSMCMLHM